MPFEEIRVKQISINLENNEVVWLLNEPLK